MKVRGARMSAAWWVVCSALVMSGCSQKSGGGPTPTEPTPTLPTLGVPTGLRLESVDIRERLARLVWNHVDTSASYVVEVGTSAGSTDVRVINTGNPNTSIDVTDLPPDKNIFVRVRAQRPDSTGTPSNEVRFYMQDYKQLTEALLLQTGLYWPSTVPFDGVRGWPAGSHIRVRVSSTITAEQRRGIEGVVAQLGYTGAPFTAHIEPMNSNQATYGRNEIRVITVQQACQTGLGCASFADTNLQQTSAVRIFGGVIVYLGGPGQRGDAADVASHEMGHALFGLWHVNYQKVPEAPQFPSQFGKPDFPFIAMFSGAEPVFRSPLSSLSDLETQILQGAFRAGISAGARRADLHARGLIN